jgi:hypothetical protein
VNRETQRTQQQGQEQHEENQSHLMILLPVAGAMNNSSYPRRPAPNRCLAGVQA